MKLIIKLIIRVMIYPVVFCLACIFGLTALILWAMGVSLDLTKQDIENIKRILMLKGIK